jgi:hypothetical protein
MVGMRLLDTLTGIVVGLLVNLLVWPPLRAIAPRRGRSTSSTIAWAACCAAMDAVDEAQPVRVETRPAATVGEPRKSIA